MTGVALLESQATGEEPVASAGTVSRSRPVMSAPAGTACGLSHGGQRCSVRRRRLAPHGRGGGPGP